MPGDELRIIPVRGLPEIRPNDDLAGLITGAVHGLGLEFESGDILVIAQKVVSKAEGRIVPLASVKPSPLAATWAERWGREAETIEVILTQARRIVRMERGILIVETEHGFICANAGVDSSNAPPGTVILLPTDPDSSARTIHKRLRELTNREIGVLISDTFGRPWREGLVNVALGVAGFEPLHDYRGQSDSFGRRLGATVIATADELASAAEIVMGKKSGIPVALVRGFPCKIAEGTGRQLVRPAEEDLFR